MTEAINFRDCCLTCMKIDFPLTPTSAQDNDSVKYCDKLSACISEIVST